MVNLDDIASRLDAGQYTIKDKVTMLSEVQACSLTCDAAVLDRLNRGLDTVADLQAVHAAIENDYVTRYNRPTSASVRALVASQVALQVAAQRVQDNQNALAKAWAEKQAQAALQATADSVVQARQVAAVAQAAADRFKQAQQAAATIVDQKKQASDELLSVINFNASATPVLEPQNQETV